MPRLIHIIVVTDGHRNKVGVAHSMSVAKTLAEYYYSMNPRRFNRHIELVDSATGEVTIL